MNKLDLGAFFPESMLQIKEVKQKELQPYIRTRTEALKYKAGSTGKQEDYITREGASKHIWMNMDLTEFHRSYIYDKFPNLWEIHNCIKEFRNIFQKRRVEGTNSRLKMIKRTMYGRCSKELLEAKLCYMKQNING